MEKREYNIIRVLIAEDSEPIRRRYLHILSEYKHIRILNAVSTGQQAVEQTRLLHPDISLMDIEMEERDAGLIATREILSEFPETKIIILTVYDQDDLIFLAFQLGVCDYVLKNTKPEEIIKSIEDAYAICSPIRPEIADRIRNEFRRVKTYENSFLLTLHILSTVTPTELDLLALLSQGKNRNEICAIRHVEMSTVKTQIHNILRKFEKKTIADVVEIINGMNLLPVLLRNREKVGDKK